MPEPEMWVTGGRDGDAVICCRRQRCLVAGPGHRKPFYFLEIELPYQATPKDIDRIWHQHRIDHSS